MYNADYNVNEYRVEFNVTRSSYDSFTSKNEWTKGFGKTREQAESWAKFMICKSRDYVARDDKGEVIGPDYRRIEILGVTKTS